MPIKFLTRFFNKIVDKGGEGVVYKNSYAVFKDGTSKDQIKRKAEYECNMRILDLNKGKGRNEDTFGSFLCVSECGDVSCGVSGLTDALRNEVYKRWRTKNSWEGKIISVKFKSLITTKQGSFSLYEPRYNGEQIDADAADDLDRIKEISNWRQ